MGGCFLEAVKRLKRSILVLWYATRDPRCPLCARAVSAVALGYALCPFDLIPDFIPVLGLLDDLLLLPALIWLAIRLIPAVVWRDAQLRADAEPMRLSQNWRAAAVVTVVWIAGTLATLHAVLEAHTDGWARRNPVPLNVALGAAMLLAATALAVREVRRERARRDDAAGGAEAPAELTAEDAEKADGPQGRAGRVLGTSVSVADALEGTS